MGRDYDASSTSHQYLLVVALFPNPIPIAVATTVTNAPMVNIAAPGTNIASLSSPVDVDPMMSSGKPILDKVMPTTNAIFHCIMNLDRA